MTTLARLPPNDMLFALLPRMWRETLSRCCDV